MYNFRQNLVNSSKYNIKCPYSMTAEYITVHNTANDASANNEVSYMINNNNQVSFHYAIDDKEVVQGIPLNRNTWNAGDGSGKGNRASISIEICYSKSGGARFDQAEINASEFIAKLLKERGWGIDRVKKHQDWNGKYCPHRTLNLGWERFLDMIQSNIKTAKQPKSNPINTEGLRYKAHVENIGDCEQVNDGMVAGTVGSSLRLEGLYIDARDLPYDVKLNVKYHEQNVGWTLYEDVKHDTLIGSQGKSHRLECLIFEIEGLPKGKDLYCSGHCQNIGWIENVPSGYPIGTVQQALRLEALKLWIGNK